MVGNYNLEVQRQAGKLQLGHWFKAECLENIFQTGFCLPWWAWPVPSGFFCCSTCDCRTAGKTSFYIMWKQASPVSNTHIHCPAPEWAHCTPSGTLQMPASCFGSCASSTSSSTSFFFAWLSRCPSCCEFLSNVPDFPLCLSTTPSQPVFQNFELFCLCPSPLQNVISKYLPGWEAHCGA